MKSAVALALAASLTAPSASFAAPQATSSQWSKFRSSKPGAEVTLRVSGKESTRRYFIAADDEAIALLNLSDPALPPGVGRLLRRSVAEHPDHFPVPDGKTFQLDDKVTLDTFGLFVGGRKIANYDALVQRIARADVEGGAVSIEVDSGWPVSKQVLVTLGGIVAAGALSAVIACGAKGCD